MRPLARFALAVLLVLAALLGAGAGAGLPGAESEPRSVSAAADPGAESHDAAETEAAPPIRGVRRPAPPRAARCAPPGGDAVPVPVPSAQGDAPRSAVMRC
ncbi:hypothetical protein [Streptomyces sp. NPDC053431]|uniref:hypothetical protein n=1 Tax=Streptomyces sp. NPDC053431 TaxID=3365703 RepID=UPI0037D55E89